MKFYVVTKGEYSDYRIVAVTMNREKAELIAKYTTAKWEESVIEEYEESAITEYDKFYRVTLDKDGGARIEDISCDPLGIEFALEQRVFYELYDIYTVYVVCKNEDAALKIASERLTLYRAQKEGLL